MDERIARLNPTLFWAKVDRRSDNECWPFLGQIDRYGYGAVTCHLDGRRRKFGAHRAAYELSVGPIPKGLVIDHLCRNRACQNPRHLEPVTNEENVRRGDHSTSGRQTTTLVGGTCSNGHHLTEQNTRPRKRYPHLLSCVDCEKARVARWKAKQAAQ